MQQHQDCETEKGSTLIMATPWEGAPQLVKMNYHLRKQTNVGKFMSLNILKSACVCFITCAFMFNCCGKLS